MTALVLFYAHAAVVAGSRYKLPSTPRSSSRTRACFAKARAATLDEARAHSEAAQLVLAAPMAGFRWVVQGRSNDVTVADGFLRLFFLGARVVAKMAHGASAVRRLALEFRVYTTFHALQGVVIPRVVSLYKSRDQDTRVLILSHAAKALRDFGELESDERWVLFRRLVRLHQKGIQHDDLEARNVTKSESGPIIIDFDRAEMDHACRGASCAELKLLAVANALDLDAGTCLAAAEADDLADARADPATASVALSAAVLVVGGWFLHRG
ncbi:hypothetical protein B0H14DRAFT_3508017 [Mycena olivaceomarginata]|nr:hypothetical protein B0H14DRAFT_3508017 [Mycena olivaceomarginata]